MSDMRSCIKPGCRWPAVATLSYRYATSEVWLSDMGEPHPATHDLCPHHADSMTVPRNWTLVDDRQPAEPVREPSAAEIIERATRLRTRTAVMLSVPSPPPEPPSRYTALLALLPTYAPDALPAGPDGDGRTSAQPGDAHDAIGRRSVLMQSARIGVHEQPLPPIPTVGPRQPAAPGPASRRRVSAPTSPTQALTPAIRERAADLAGPVVGTIQIDLERSVEGEAARLRPPEATIVQLPLARWQPELDHQS